MHKTFKPDFGFVHKIVDTPDERIQEQMIRQHMKKNKIVLRRTKGGQWIERTLPPNDR